MLKEQYITVSGLVATTPRHLVTQEGLAITSFRLAAQVEEDDKIVFTNWFTITAFRSLAINSATSISKGDRVLVFGTLKVRDWDNGERAGTSVEIEARNIGHDLTIGTSVWTRNTYTKTEESGNE